MKGGKIKPYTDYCHIISGNYPPTKWELFRRLAYKAFLCLIIIVEVAVLVVAWVIYLGEII